MGNDANPLGPRRARESDGALAGSIVEVVILAGDEQRRTVQNLRFARNATRYHLTISPGDQCLAGSRFCHKHDVVIVRAGTLVFGNWLDRLRAAAYSEPDIGTASPFSNTGQLCVYPNAFHQELTYLWDWKTIDQIASEENGNARLEVPEPGDCCVYIRRECLDDLSAAPLVHGRKLPWRHVLAADTCVYQIRRGQSIAAASIRPNCIPEPVRQFAINNHLQADPGRIFRRSIDLGRLHGPQPAMLLITHAGGGGTERHVRDMAEALEREGIRGIILRPTADGLLSLERLAVTCTPSLVYEPSQEYYALLQGLRRLGVTHVHVHHLLGHPPATERLISDLALPYDWTIHDYFTICPRIALMDDRGGYCGEPGPEGCNRCLAARGKWGDVRDGTEIGRWRSRYAPLLRGARRVFVPHRDVGRRMSNYLPDVDFVVRGHFETLLHARRVAAPLSRDKALRIAVLGTLAPHKGIHILAACAKDALRRDLPMRFQVIGTAQPREELAAFGNVEITGEYREEDVFDLLESQACHCALCPSIWPETYCFTLSIAQMAGLYTVGFDLGAQGARIQESGWGEVVPLGTAPAKINDLLLALRERLSEAPPPPCFAEYSNLLRDYFDLDLTGRFNCQLPVVSREGSERQEGGASLVPRPSPLAPLRLRPSA
jgi:glycosyltransferase involved in cell wall biosynthesis